MLVLSRKKDETVVIDDNIEITIVDVKGDTVKLGITAPRDVKIYRGELLEAIRKANIEAAEGAPTDLAGLEQKLRSKGIDKK
jgi:carbon storage regulator